MKTSLRALALISLFALITAGRAADGKPAAELVTASPAKEPTLPLNINVDFPGGSISKLLAAIAKVDGVSFNIINGEETPDFGKVELPAFSLRNVNLPTVSEVLQSLLEKRGFQLQRMGGGNPNVLVCVLGRREMVREKQPGPPPIQFLSFQLGPFLTAQSVDDIVGAIHAAWELEPGHDRDALHVKFHPGTTILLVSGPPEAINLTRSVLIELKRPDRRGVTPPLITPPTENPPEKR